MAQLAQGLGFDLADALAGDVELLADFFQRVVGVHFDAEAHAQHLGFPRRQRIEDFLGDAAQAGVHRRIGRGQGELVLDEVAEMGIVVVADRGFHGDGLLGNLHDLADLVFRHVHLLGQGGRIGLGAGFLQDLAADPVHFVDRFDHVHRDTDGACLVGDGAGDGLADPPRGVGGELVAAAVFELVHRLHQADVAFLDQVEELQTTVGVFLGDGDDQAQVGLGHFALGAAGLGFAGGHLLVDVLEFLERNTDAVLQVDQALLLFEDVRRCGNFTINPG